MSVLHTLHQLLTRIETDIAQAISLRAKYVENEAKQMVVEMDAKIEALKNKLERLLHGTPKAPAPPPQKPEA